MEPLQLWYAIIEAAAEYHNKNGHPAKVLKLPVLQAYQARIAERPAVQATLKAEGLLK